MNAAARNALANEHLDHVFDAHSKLQMARGVIHDAAYRLPRDQVSPVLELLAKADDAGELANAEGADARAVAEFLTLVQACQRRVDAFAESAEDLAVYAADHILQSVKTEVDPAPAEMSIPKPTITAGRSFVCAAYNPENCGGHLLSIRSVISDALQRNATALLHASAETVDRAISASDMAARSDATATDIANFVTLVLRADELLQDAARAIDKDGSLWCAAELMQHVAASARALMEGGSRADNPTTQLVQTQLTDESTKAITEEAWARTGEAIGVFDAAFLAFKSEPIRPVMQKVRMACSILSGELDPDPGRFPRVDQCRIALQVLTWAHTELDRLIADGSDGEEGDSPAGTAARTGGLTLLGLAVSGLEQVVGAYPKTEQPARADAPAFCATAPAEAQAAAAGRREMPQTLEGVLYECERNTQHALGCLEEAAERLDDDELRGGVEVVRAAHTTACLATSDAGTAADFEELETLLKAADVTLLPVAEGLGDDAVWCAVSLVGLSHLRLRDTVLAGAGLEMRHAEVAHA